MPLAVARTLRPGRNTSSPGDEPLGAFDLVDPRAYLQRSSHRDGNAKADRQFRCDRHLIIQRRNVPEALIHHGGGPSAMRNVGPAFMVTRAHHVIHCDTALVERLVPYAQLASACIPTGPAQKHPSVG